MDIDEFLRKKRELEHKKEVLEAKEKLTIVKVREAKPESPELRKEPEAESTQRASSSIKPWMVINLIILILVVSVAMKVFVFPGQESDGTLEDISAELVTGKAVQDVQQVPAVEDQTEKIPVEEVTTEEEPEEIFPGPTFSLSIQDKTLGTFDANGKISGNVLVIKDAAYYEDLQLLIQNKESSKIKCIVDRSIDIDNDFNGKYESSDVSLERFKVEIAEDQLERIDDAVPSSSIEVGNYAGKGMLLVEYESHCYFCLDEKCDQWEEKGKESEKAIFKVSMNSKTTEDSNETED